MGQKADNVVGGRNFELSTIVRLNMSDGSIASRKLKNENDGEH